MWSFCVSGKNVFTSWTGKNQKYQARGQKFALGLKLNWVLIISQYLHLIFLYRFFYFGEMTRNEKLLSQQTYSCCRSQRTEHFR
jgi:hypothetical protein